VSFWDGRELWLEPMLATILGAALLGYLGFFVVLRRMAFMSAALSQVSGLGVAASFWVGSFVGIEPHPATPQPLLLHPLTWAFGFAALGAVAMSLPPRSRRVTPESVVATAYLGASAFVLIVLSSPRIAQEAHEVSGLLFGSAVVVARSDLIQLSVAAVITFVIHALLFKNFLFSSFDPETARVSGVPVRKMDLVLNLTLALSVAVATRALGALPVFSFLVLPAGAAMLFSERLRVVIALAIGIAITCGVGGYYLAWQLSLPVGSLMVALAVGFWIIGGLKRLAEKVR
jgi:zinc transport system permease protein